MRSTQEMVQKEIDSLSIFLSSVEFPGLRWPALDIPSHQVKVTFATGNGLPPFDHEVFTECRLKTCLIVIIEDILPRGQHSDDL